ncbi:MAG: hypothetical protein JXA53_09290 [Bacteroidales bacterium]|nr:hypothetical protein [Bacteroidales bacterium]
MKKSKNKKINYLLIPVVILIWGIIIYKMFFSGISYNISQSQHVVKQKSKVELITSRIFRLKLNYSDPFLKDVDKTEIIEKVNDNNYYGYNTDRLAETTTINWPSVKYFGLTKNNESKVGWLNIDGKSILVHNGDEYNNVSVKKIMGDSILLQFKGEYKTFKM